MSFFFISSQSFYCTSFWQLTWHLYVINLNLPSDVWKPWRCFLTKTFLFACFLQGDRPNVAAKKNNFQKILCTTPTQVFNMHFFSASTTMLSRSKVTCLTCYRRLRVECQRIGCYNVIELCTEGGWGVEMEVNQLMCHVARRRRVAQRDQQDLSESPCRSAQPVNTTRSGHGPRVRDARPQMCDMSGRCRW